MFEPAPRTGRERGTFVRGKPFFYDLDVEKRPPADFYKRNPARGGPVTYGSYRNVQTLREGLRVNQLKIHAPSSLAGQKIKIPAPLHQEKGRGTASSGRMEPNFVE